MNTASSCMLYVHTQYTAVQAVKPAVAWTQSYIHTMLVLGLKGTQTQTS